MATKKQISFIKGLARKIFIGPGGGYSDDLYRGWLGKRWNVASSKDLSTSRAITAIDELKAMRNGDDAPDTHRGRFYARGEKGFAYRLTPDQADEIARHQDLLGWDLPTLGRFIQRQTGKPHAVSSLTKRQAGNVITGMQRVLESREEEAHVD